MISRDFLLSTEYFDRSIAFKKNAIAEDEQLQADLPDWVVRPDALASSIVGYRHNVWMAEYSRGYPLQTLRAEFPAIITAWENLRRIDVEGTFKTSFHDGLDDYVNSLWLLSQAYLIKAEPEIVKRTLVCIGNEGKDLLFERLVAAIAPDLVRKPATKLLFPKAYQSLYEALDTPADQQAGAVQQFLKKWYGKMRQVGWYDNHKGPEGGGYFGYWCWEAAGVVVAFGLDDASFRENIYYPKDLADFARAHLNS